MKKIALLAAIPVFMVLSACGASADEASAFKTGPVFEGFGQTASIETDRPIPTGTVFKVSFDVAEGAKPGEMSRQINSLARFINMHAAAGVPLENINAALVIHGGASKDLMTNAAYKAMHDGQDNGSAALVTALMEKGVPVILCGQSAVYHKIDKEDLLPGVEMALSAMTAHALLQQEGYTLNPF